MSHIKTMEMIDYLFTQVNANKEFIAYIEASYKPGHAKEMMLQKKRANVKADEDTISILTQTLLHT